MGVELLLQQASREITVGDVCVPVLIPGFRSIAGNVVAEMIDKGRIERVAIRKNSKRVDLSW